MSLSTSSNSPIRPRACSDEALRQHRHYVEVRERLYGKRITQTVEKLAPKIVPPANSGIFAPVTVTATPKENIAVAVTRVRLSRHQIARKVIAITAAHFGFTTELLCGQRRKQPIVRARYIVVHMVSELTGMSTPELGLKLGGRDHTTIIHSLRRAADLFVTNPLFRSDYEIIKGRVETETAAE